MAGVGACPVSTRRNGQQHDRSPRVKEAERVFRRAISEGDATHEPAIPGLHVKTAHRRSGRAKARQATLLSVVVCGRAQKPA